MDKQGRKNKTEKHNSAEAEKQNNIKTQTRKAEKQKQQKTEKQKNKETGKLKFKKQIEEYIFKKNERKSDFVIRVFLLHFPCHEGTEVIFVTRTGESENIFFEQIPLS